MHLNNLSVWPRFVDMFCWAALSGRNGIGGRINILIAAAGDGAASPGRLNEALGMVCCSKRRPLQHRGLQLWRASVYLAVHKLCTDCINGAALCACRFPWLL